LSLWQWKKIQEVLPGEMSLGHAWRAYFFERRPLYMRNFFSTLQTAATIGVDGAWKQVLIIQRMS
jgi:hypothetical protein